jgi:hypothetical protein
VFLPDVGFDDCDLFIVGLLGDFNHSVLAQNRQFSTNASQTNILAVVKDHSRCGHTHNLGFDHILPPPHFCQTNELPFAQHQEGNYLFVCCPLPQQFLGAVVVDVDSVGLF